MARKTPQERLYDELLDRYGQRVADAFLEAVADLQKNVDVDRLIAAIAAGRLDDALLAMHLDAAAFTALEEALRGATLAAGNGYTTLIGAEKGAQALAAVFRFSVLGNPRAEALLREQSAELVTRVVEEQIALMRSALAQGMARGVNPTTTALDIVGRIDKATGVRSGGIVGLTREQAAWVQSVNAELRSGDPAMMANYLTRKLRDKRYDAAVRRAMIEGRPLDDERIGKASTAYYNRALKLRGNFIGRTETMRALNAAQLEAYIQAAEAGGFLDSEVERFWRDASDLRVRHSHAAMDGQRVIGITQPFRSPTGARMMYPGDVSLGAKAEDVIACRCWAEIRLDYLGRQLRLEATGA